MKSLLFFGFLFSTMIFAACGDDDAETHTAELEYEILIDSPDGSNQHVGDVMNLKVNVHDHNGNTVHHVKIRIYNADTNEEVFSGPSDAHVHATTGDYDFEQEFTLDATEHTDWVFEAKAWNHDGTYEVMETVNFHVHP